MPMWKLTPACKDYLWGGEKLREKYHIESTQASASGSQSLSI